ncbi:MAG: aldehyde dehydrogenase family protein [Anaerolineales bacterium]|nr:aldehyde dehydrogenase family protein [Anaerolineales bacterium]
MTTDKHKTKVIYATLSMPDETLHLMFEEAVEQVKQQFGQTHPMFIGGKPALSDQIFESHSPINTGWSVGCFQKGNARHASDALSAARTVFPVWRDTPWQERVRILRRAAGIIEDRIYKLAALASLEVGKNRLESIGEVQETADLITYYCDQMEANGGFIRPMLQESANVTNTSTLKPHGVWAVISPFNFPLALSGGPAGAALVAGNTVVLKPATATPYSVLGLARCFFDAGLPDGVLNYISGPGRTLGRPLIKGADGITFTGSFDVGMDIYRAFASGRYPRPCIAEMGGKNPVIVSRQANLDAAAQGVMRSAFGLQGQKCSACSRVYVERPVIEQFTEKLLALTKNIVVGDPTRREVWMGPVIDKKAYQDYDEYCQELGRAGRILFGGMQLDKGEFSKGYFCSPTIVDQLPFEHPLWKQELFLPIVAVAPVDTLEVAMDYANDGEYGLTAGFFSNDPDEIELFCNRIQAGVLYVNRMGGATTGAWPGYQAFGGWKGSGSTGKAGGSFYYVQQYMREQSCTVIELK